MQFAGGLRILVDSLTSKDTKMGYPMLIQSDGLSQNRNIISMERQPLFRSIMQKLVIKYSLLIPFPDSSIECVGTPGNSIIPII